MRYPIQRLLILSAGLMLFSCQKRATYDLLEPHKPLIDHVTQKNSSFYSISKKNQSKPDKKLAIGVFDSGIGGLTVFDAMINIDFYNSDHQNQPDGIRDFQHEQFVYLADQANMPYSNYAEEGKELLLAEHILKDALFLLNNRYHPNPGSPETANDKPAIKAMVIACNTATAYGKPHVEELCRVLDNNIRVIGVIDAGCKGAIDLIDAGEKATIAVFATPATVKSMAYVNTLSQVKKGHTGTIHIIQQGGKGLHESIDNKPGFIGRHYTKPYDEYQGPSLNSELYKIEKELLPYYCFDTTANHLLCNRNPLKSADTIALNSVENYARYHMVSIVEQLRKQKNPTPLKAVILGCTHYPYVTDLLSVITDELRATDRYRPLIADTVYFVDPAINTAKELYAHLNEQQLFSNNPDPLLEKSRFFLTVPNSSDPDIQTGPDGNFTYDYQYKTREINQLKEYTLTVPLSSEVISEEQLNLIRDRLPSTWKLVNNNMIP